MSGPPLKKPRRSRWDQPAPSAVPKSGDSNGSTSTAATEAARAMAASITANIAQIKTQKADESSDTTSGTDSKTLDAFAAAALKAKKINAMMTARGIVPTVPVVTEKDTKEICINDFPKRFVLTRGQFQKDIMNRFDVVVTTRGRYVRPGEAPVSGEKPLYLFIQGTSEAVQNAVEEIESVMKGEMTVDSGVAPRRAGVPTGSAANVPSESAVPRVIVPIGDDFPKDFDYVSNSKGPNNSYLEHISALSRSRVVVVGSAVGGSGPLRIEIISSNQMDAMQAKSLATNLVATVRQKAGVQPTECLDVPGSTSFTPANASIPPPPPKPRPMHTKPFPHPNMPPPPLLQFQPPLWGHVMPMSAPMSVQGGLNYPAPPNMGSGGDEPLEFKPGFTSAVPPTRNDEDEYDPLADALEPDTVVIRHDDDYTAVPPPTVLTKSSEILVSERKNQLRKNAVPPQSAATRPASASHNKFENGRNLHETAAEKSRYFKAKERKAEKVHVSSADPLNEFLRAGSSNTKVLNLVDYDDQDGRSVRFSDQVEVFTMNSQNANVHRSLQETGTSLLKDETRPPSPPPQRPQQRPFWAAPSENISGPTFEQRSGNNDVTSTSTSLDVLGKLGLRKSRY